jgi:hypothetical protein
VIKRLFGSKWVSRRTFALSGRTFARMAKRSDIMIGLMISLLSVFEVIKLDKDFTEKPYNLGEYKFTQILVVTFSALHSYILYIYQNVYSQLS